MSEKFESWAIVELFGHTKIAGKISEQSIGGCSFVRVDIPETPTEPAHTRLYGNGAIYGITITDEKTARTAAVWCQSPPLDYWSIGKIMRKQIEQSEAGSDKATVDIPF